MALASFIAAWVYLLFKLAAQVLVSVMFISCIIWGFSLRKSDAPPK